MRSFKRGKHQSAFTEAAQRRQLNGAVVAQWVINIVLIVLICILFGLQSQTSNYLQGRGEFADRERAQQKAFICELIGQLHAPEDSQLWDLAVKLRCAERPLAPSAGAATSTSPVPDSRDDSYSTSPPAPGTTGPKANASGQAGGPDRTTGTKVPAPTSAPAPATGSRATGSPTPPPSSEPPPDGSGGGLTVCVPLTSLCVNL